jgi:hypothetical protein
MRPLKFKIENEGALRIHIINMTSFNSILQHIFVFFEAHGGSIESEIKLCEVVGMEQLIIWNT